MSFTNAIAEFWPAPSQLKPRIDITLSTAGWPCQKASTWSITAFVRFWLAPGGSDTIANRLPVSSSGRNDDGSRAQVTPSATRIAR